MVTPPSPKMVERDITREILADFFLAWATADDTQKASDFLENAIRLALTAAHAQGRAEGLKESDRLLAVAKRWRDRKGHNQGHGCDLCEAIRAAEEARRG